MKTRHTTIAISRRKLEEETKEILTKVAPKNEEQDQRGEASPADTDDDEKESKHNADESEVSTIEKSDELAAKEPRRDEVFNPKDPSSMTAAVVDASTPLAAAASSSNNITTAAMLFNDAALDMKSPRAWYETSYGTTILFIVLLHAVFFHQWNKRKTKRDVLVSYRILVQKKQWYRSIVAIVSHPPADPSSSSSSIRRPLAMMESMGNSADGGLLSTSLSSSENNRSHRCRRCNTICSSVMGVLQPITHGHLSGLPLLAYNSHLLWSCRALEPLCGSSWHYARILLALTLVALLLELRLTHNLLQTTTHSALGRSTQIRQSLLNRGIGTPTMLTSALLVLYRSNFAYVPLQVLPFLPILPSNMDPTLSFAICISLLLVLSWRSHPVMAVWTGAMSGILWTAPLTAFLGNVYWGTCLLILVVTTCALSMRASSNSTTAALVPCVDYVAWDGRGVIRTFDGEQGQLGASSSHPQDDDDSEDDDGDYNDDLTRSEGGGGDIESRPLLDRGSSIMSGTGGGDDEIHGRLPLMDMETEIDEIEMPARSSMTGPAGLSRRAGGGGTADGSSSQTAR